MKYLSKPTGLWLAKYRRPILCDHHNVLNIDNVSISKRWHRLMSKVRTEIHFLWNQGRIAFQDRSHQLRLWLVERCDRSWILRPVLHLQRGPDKFAADLNIATSVTEVQTLSSLCRSCGRIRTSRNPQQALCVIATSPRGLQHQRLLPVLQTLPSIYLRHTQPPQFLLQTPLCIASTHREVFSASGFGFLTRRRCKMIFQSIGSLSAPERSRRNLQWNTTVTSWLATSLTERDPLWPSLRATRTKWSEMLLTL